MFIFLKIIPIFKFFFFAPMNSILIIVENHRRKHGFSIGKKISNFFGPYSIFEKRNFICRQFLSNLALLGDTGISHVWYLKFSNFSSYLSITDIKKRGTVRFEIKKYLTGDRFQRQKLIPNSTKLNFLILFNNFKRNQNVLDLWKIFKNLVPNFDKYSVKPCKVLFISLNGSSNLLEFRFYIVVRSLNKFISKRQPGEKHSLNDLKDLSIAEKDRRNIRWKILRRLKVLEYGPRMTLTPYF